MTALTIAERLNAKKTASGWSALCPAHDDQNASLSIAEGDDGRVLLKCHAGCTTDAICAVAGIKMADLFPPTAAAAKPRIVAVYDYVAVDGTLLYQVVRYSPKSFRQRRPDPDKPGEFVWDMKCVERVLYRLPAVVKAVAEQADIFIAEGEKDADALAGLSLVATCNPGGAGKWLPQYTTTLTGANVIIVADKDEAGRKHAELVRRELTGKAASVTVIELPDRGGHKVKDAADWIAAGGTADELAEIVRTAQAGDMLPVSYASKWITETPPPVDPILSDIFDAGDKVPVIGSSKSRKTFYVLQLALNLTAGRGEFLGWGIPKPRRVLIVQLEVKEAHYWRRVHNLARVLRITAAEVADRLCVASLRGREVKPAQIVELASKHRAEVIVIDPLYKLAEGDENLAADMKPLLATFDRMAEKTGAAVLYVHHNPKGTAGDRDTRDRGAGSGVISRDYDSCIYLTDHKEEGLLVCETVLRNYPPRDPFTIEWQDGRFIQRGDMSAVVRTTKNKNAGKSDYRDAVIKMARENPSLSFREIAKRIGCGKSTVELYYPQEMAT